MRILLAAWVSVALCSEIQGGERDFARQALAKYKTVQRPSATVPESAVSIGITEELLLTRVELRLRSAGVRIHGDAWHIQELVESSSDKVNEGYLEQVRRDSPFAFINCSLNILPPADTSNAQVAYNIGLLVSDTQEGDIEKGAFFGSLVVVWQESILGTTHRSTAKDRVRSSLDDLLDLFINDWLAVHPKQ